MEALYFKGLLSQIFTVRRISLASVLCVEMSPEARQSRTKQGKGTWCIKAFLSTSVCKLAREMFLTLSLPSPCPPENTGFIYDRGAVLCKCVLFLECCNLKI